MGRTAVQIVAVTAMTALALAANHFFFQWALLTESLSLGILR